MEQSITKNAGDILAEMAETFKQRGAVYKNNRAIASDVFKALFPEGITLNTPDDHERFHILSLIVVKLSRYVANWDQGGHQDSAHDAAVYFAILEEIDGKIAARVAPVEILPPPGPGAQIKKP